ncbi:hypothetical protein AC579_8299 [Pseudocercospora musae]|uniref:Uncharacterized protein n=1 Tax=Pseudocercospora musae TaxID=113226 RepID=A0A139HR37_9PEZI|nr:hypothetical protein AC579_8299 [Pseudocercospora musae]
MSAPPPSMAAHHHRRRRRKRGGIKLFRGPQRTLCASIFGTRKNPNRDRAAANNQCSDHSSEPRALISYHTTRKMPWMIMPRSVIKDAHLRQANTRARLEEIRDALTQVIEADERSCLKCVTTKAARALFSYLRDVREIKGNMNYSKTEKKAAKQEMKTVARSLKKDLKPTR